jgi:hypothetical protein
VDQTIVNDHIPVRVVEGLFVGMLPQVVDEVNVSAAMCLFVSDEQLVRQAVA